MSVRNQDPMSPEFRILSAKTLIGIRLRMSLADNKTFDLWRGFMPRRKEIRNVVSHDLFAVQVYDDVSYFAEYKPDVLFDKWATVEVSRDDEVPAGMESLVLVGGLYAVFIHKGPASEGFKTFGYIFGTWLPGSPYMLDDRPHFEILGEKYKHDDPKSEEEVWIPVKKK